MRAGGSKPKPSRPDAVGLRTSLSTLRSSALRRVLSTLIFTIAGSRCTQLFPVVQFNFLEIESFLCDTWRFYPAEMPCLRNIVGPSAILGKKGHRELAADYLGHGSVYAGIPHRAMQTRRGLIAGRGQSSREPENPQQMRSLRRSYFERLRSRVSALNHAFELPVVHNEATLTEAPCAPPSQ